MKKLSLILAVLTLMLTLSSCDVYNKEENGRLRVCATNFAMYDFARCVCGEDADVTMLVPAGAESHDFEATLSDIDKIATSDLFVHTGGESEDWVEDVFVSLDSMDVEVNDICAADFVVGLEEEVVEGMQIDSHEEEEAAYDEHVWTSIPNAESIIDGIADAVVQLKPELEEKIRQRCADYKAELDEIDGEIMTVVENSTRRTIIVADRFPFRYFTERYGLDYYAAFSGCTSNTEPTLSTINFLINKVREENIPAVITIEFSDKKCAEAVANETGCGIVELHSAHNVTKEELEAGVTYAEIMRTNLESLKKVLQ